MALSTVEAPNFLEALDSRRIEVSARLDPKQRAKLGQFFTPTVTARLMASMFTAQAPAIRLLDAGAGIGLLTAAFVDDLCRRSTRPKLISVVVFELDEGLLPQLMETLEACRSACEQAGIRFESEIRHEDFIAAATASLGGHMFGSTMGPFDRAILNPPYRKINSNSRERRLLRSVGIETTNLYTGFLALTADLLKPGGELVAITPRSFCNGPYFRSFRREFLASMALEHVHVFEARDDAFRDDAVLQETVIFKATRGALPDQVTITSSTGPDSGDVRSRVVEFSEVVRPDDPDVFIRLVSDESGSEIAERMDCLPVMLKDLGLTVSTGRVVDFRATEYLRSEPESSTVPLIYPGHFGEDGYVAWPNPGSRKPNALARTDASEGLLVPAGTYVLVRRFSAKEERRRVVASVYDADRVSPLPVGFENHLNYYHLNGQGLAVEVALGLATFLNSTQVDTYFRQFNGHTQVNATDLRSLRYPTLDELAALGEHIGSTFPAQSELDWLVEGMLFGRTTACPNPMNSIGA